MSSRMLKFAAPLLVGLAATVVSAFQMGGGMGGGGMNAAQPGRASAQARIRLAEQALAAIREQEKKGESPKDGEERLRWYRRLMDAEHDAGSSRPETTKAYAQILLAEEARAKKRFESGEAGSLAYLDAQYQRLQAEKMAAALGTGMGNSAMSRMAGMGGGMGGAGGMGGGSMAGGGGMGGGSLGGAGGMGGGSMAGGGGMGGGSMGGGGGGFGGAADSPPRRLPKQHPADLERNRAIEQRLEKAVDMRFDKTPIDDVLKFIREKTADSGGKALPIYVDPIGLQEADKTLASPVTIDLQDVPVRTTLRLVLQQIGLDYRVRDGLLYISGGDILDEADEAEAVDARLKSRAGAGMQGGTGGGFR